MTQNQNQVVNPNTQAAAADTPTTPATLLTPAQFIEQLQALVAQVPEVPSLTRQERTLLKRNPRLPDAEVQAAINVVGASEKVTHVVGQPADDVRKLVEDTNRWKAVESEVKAVLKGIADANLVRSQRTRAIAVLAYAVGQRLAREPENASLVQHVEEMKRLKALRRRKPAAPESPAPEAAPATPDTQQS